MTYKAFLKELRGLRGKFELINRGRGVNRIRGKIDCLGYCPVAGVNVAKGGENTAYDRETLKLAEGVRVKIIRAADDHAKGRVRQDLLRALGLKEPK